MTETKESVERRSYLAAMEQARQKSEDARISRDIENPVEIARKRTDTTDSERIEQGIDETEKSGKQSHLVVEEKAKIGAEDAELVRIQLEIIERERAKLEALKAELAAREKARREAEEAEKARKHAELIAREKAKREAEEKARREAEEAERAKKLAELAAKEKAKREEEAEKAKKQVELLARENAKREAEEAEKAKKHADLIAREKAKCEAEEARKVREIDKMTAKQCFRLRKDMIQREALRLVPESIARKYSVVPLDFRDNVLRVAMPNANDILVIEALETICHMRIEPETAAVEEIREAIDISYRSYEEIAEQIATISLPGEEETSIDDITPDTVADAPIAKALTVIIDGAIKARASDIHIQPEEDNVRVRYRIDGTLHDTLSLPLATGVPLISRLKILAKMNIADRQRPQDGQMSVKPKDRPEIDIRVATIPIVHGEMAALRLLDKSKALMTLPQLGFLPDSLAKYEEMLKVPYGMILVTGPTGAGKTTTLYASLNTLDKKGRNIITIEDPVEYRFKNINQIQINPRAGLTFASGLRSILRLDPNVLLVGEMRDAETAGIAVQSALTGHLVLSTIHANDAIGVVARLLDLGVEPFLIASALIGVVAQRMGRRVCRECATPVKVPPLEQVAYAKETGEERTEFLYGSGCKACSNTGYQGRIGFYEILRITDQLRSILLKGANAGELRAQALKDGMIPLIKDGMLKVKEGITTPAEVLRNAYSSE